VENAKNNKVLELFLSQATILVLSVTASTTQGVNLSDDDLNIVIECADVASKLNDYKKKILAYVESKMNFIAPNLTYIVGASTAAKLVSSFI
jgi:U4/U6 small nuclear ribonucleoprotein PRP31